mmetsp:Transcript_51139/g.121529  ORF Transcript_51139/g.121529 Transcript_51139/m.121529 type:complete len:223 (+) Transcript_51139:62-730(+)
MAFSLSPSCSRPASSSTSGMAMSLRAPSVVASHSEGQQQALSRLKEYPQRVERLKKLWIDLQNTAPGWSSSRARSSMRLAAAGAQSLQGASSCSKRRPASTSRPSSSAAETSSSALTIGLTQRQIQDLMTRELTPEDYELLLLLDSGNQPKNVLSCSAAQRLPKPTHQRWLQEDCRVCLSSMRASEDVRMIPSCGHVYHADCIEHWLTSSKATCPLCGGTVA